MNVVLPIPDDLVPRLSENGSDLARLALEAFAAEEYRHDRLTRPELRRLLGFETRAEVDGFLKSRGIADGMTIEDWNAIGVT